MKYPTPYQRIMRAAREGRGIRLSADEAFLMAQDTAIADAANSDDRAQEREFARKFAPAPAPQPEGER